MSQRLPVVRPKAVIRALERAGFFIHHTSGSHHILKHPEHPELRDRSLPQQGSKEKDSGLHHRAGEVHHGRIYRTVIKAIIAFTFKIETLYAACSPELGVVSYGKCQDETLNNLIDEIRQREQVGTGDEKNT